MQVQLKLLKSNNYDYTFTAQTQSPLYDVKTSYYPDLATILIMKIMKRPDWSAKTERVTKDSWSAMWPYNIYRLIEVQTGAIAIIKHGRFL